MTDIFEDDADLAEFDAACQAQPRPVTFAQAAAKAKQLAQKLGIAIYLVPPDEESKYAGHGDWTLSKESREQRQEFLALHEFQKRLPQRPDLVDSEPTSETDWTQHRIDTGLAPTDGESLLDGYLAFSGMAVDFDDFTSIELDH